MVAADREALGDVQGRSLIHLQCHFGLDTLAWSRLGADVTGVDFSPRAIATAIDLAKRDGARARFIEADLYATPQVVPDVFNVVYTSGGVLCWLPEISTWASVVSRLLKPGGVFYIREAHPVLWSLDDEREDEELFIGLPYFEMSEPKRWEGAPAWDEGRAASRPHYVWQHGLGEIVTSLIEAGLTIQFLREHRTCLWQALHFMVQDEDGWSETTRSSRSGFHSCTRSGRSRLSKRRRHSRFLMRGACLLCRPRIERPNKPVGISPLGLALDDKGVAADREMIALV